MKPPPIISRVPTPLFNRLCIDLALIWLGVTIPCGIARYPTWPDFTQFYMGGVMARLGQWSSLYPIPLPTSHDNAGLEGDSALKPFAQDFQVRHRIRNGTRFILPPPTALLLAPLGLFSYTAAFWIWTAILILCAWGVGIQAGFCYRLIVHRETRWEGLLVLLVGFSPMTARAIRIANTTPILALCIGFVILSLLPRQPREQGSPRARRWRSARAGAAILVGGLLKYATAILLPLFIAARRWRTLIIVSILSLAMLAITVHIAGVAPFVEWARKIVPTLSRPSKFPGNQSLEGYLTRALPKGHPLPPYVLDILGIASVSLLAAALLIIFQFKRRDWHDPITVFASSALLLLWMLIFGPMCWEHYPIFLCPLWGWMLWEARHPGPRRRLLILAFALMYVPAGIIRVRGIQQRDLLIPEPFNSWQLWGMVLMFLIALTRCQQILGRPMIRRKPRKLAPVAA